MDTNQAVSAPVVAVPVAEAVEKEVWGPAPRKPQIPREIMKAMAYAYVHADMTRFIEASEPEKIARKVIESGVSEISKIQEIISDNAGIWFEMENEDLDDYFDEDSIAELGERIDRRLVDARFYEVKYKIIEILLKDKQAAAQSMATEVSA